MALRGVRRSISGSSCCIACSLVALTNFVISSMAIMSQELSDVTCDDDDDNDEDAALFLFVHCLNPKRFSKSGRIPNCIARR
jgi:hypothetical protein